ncbi:MAG: hypothetical protein ACOC4G_14545 [Bacillota bacterium]
MSEEQYPAYEVSRNNPYDDSVLLKKDTIYLDDGRPVLCQLWKEYEYTFLSYYFSVKELENCTKEEILDYLEENGMKNLTTSDNLTTDDISLEKKKSKENNFWVLTINFGDE